MSSVDAVPTVAGAAKVAAAQAATSGTALTLVSALGVGIAPNAPVIAANGSQTAQAVVKTVMLEPGFAFAATAAGSAAITVTLAQLALFSRIGPGLNLAICAGVGSTWLLATVIAVSGTTVTLNSPMGVTLAAAPMALANGSQRNDELPVSVIPWLTAGAVAALDPRSGLTRGVSVTSSNAGDTTWTVTVRGFDVYMFPMTEIISVAAAGVAYGKKAFKYIGSVTPLKGGGGVTTGTFSIGTSDLFGIHMRSDAWEYLSLFYAGQFLGTSLGWVAADVTNPATGITGDVRGTLQLSAAGPTGNFAAGGAPDGTKRLQIYQSIAIDNLYFGTVNNPVPMFGATQFAG